MLDARPDLERLIDLVKNAHGFTELEIGYEALKELPAKERYQKDIVFIYFTQNTKKGVGDR